MIMMWSKDIATIPSGWALCDGKEYKNSDGSVRIKTPDLRGRFVIGPNSSSTKAGVDSSINAKPEPTGDGVYTELQNDSYYIDPIHDHILTFRTTGYNSGRLAYTQDDMYDKTRQEPTLNNEGTPTNPTPKIRIRPTNTSLHYIIRIY